MPTMPYLTFVSFLPLLFVQIFLYRRSARVIASTQWSGHIRALAIVALKGLFITVNVLFIGVGLVVLSRAASSPRMSSVVWETLSSILYPLVAWQAGSVGSFVVIVLMDALKALFRRRRNGSPIVSSSASVQSSRRRFISQVGRSLALAPFGISAHGVYVASRAFQIERVEVSGMRIPDALRGLTIVQLTDIHVGPFMSERRLEEYARIVNRLEPDLIVITGDFVSSSHRYVAPAVRALSSLRARLGVFGTIGNHEHYTDSISSLIDEFSRHNMKILLNESVHLDVDGVKLHLVGIDYLPSTAVGFDEVIHGLTADGPTILLSHQPNVFPRAAQRGIDLTLAGHTHGGQIVLDVLGLKISPVSLRTPYVAGLFHLGDSRLYVSRGLGTTGPPVRVNAPPEITHLTLG